MWKCSACQNENKDEYRYCLSCGNPRPGKDDTVRQPQNEESGDKRKSGAVTVILLILAFLLIVAIAVMIIFFPKLSRQADDPDEESTGSVHRSRAESREDAESRGGISSFIFGGESACREHRQHSKQYSSLFHDENPFIKQTPFKNRN